MKKVLATLGIVGACALCCAIPFAIPFVGALLASSAGLAIGLETAICAGILLIGGAWMLVLYRRSARAKAAGCAPGGQCGSGTGGC